MKVIPKYQLGNKTKKQNYEWTRLRTAKGYVYAKTRNGQAIEYSPNGFFRVYEKPDNNSHSYETTFENASEGNIPSVQRKPDNHAAAVAQQKEIDKKVDAITPGAEDLFTAGTLGGMNNLSPTQWVRRAYDLGEAIKGNMSWDKFGNSWFYGNNGVLSDEYARENPNAAMAINLAGDVAAFGGAGLLRRMPTYSRMMQAEDQLVKNIVADNWKNLERGSIGYDVRTGPVSEEIAARYMPKHVEFENHPSNAILKVARRYIRPDLERVNFAPDLLMSDSRGSGTTIVKKPNAISVEELQPEAKYLTTAEAEISHPEVVRDLANNHTKGDFIEDIAKGKEVELPLFNDSGVKPNVVTVAEVAANKRPQIQRYVTTLKGTQQIDGPYKTHQSMGGYDYSAGGENAMDNAIEYVAVDRPWEASTRLGQRYGYGSPQYKYAMERIKLIDELSRKYKIKWGKDSRNLENIDWDDFKALEKAINPKSVMKNSRGTNDLDMSMEDKIAKSIMSPEDFIRYRRAIREYSEFWGAGENALQAGGVHQQAIAVPNQMERVLVESTKPMDYQDLTSGRIRIGIRGKDIPVKKMVNPIKEKIGESYIGVPITVDRYSINALAKTLDKLNHKYFSVKTLFDPNLGITHGAKPGLITRGMKKGGKIKVFTK